MSLYEQWISNAYNEQTGKVIEKFWNEYLPAEQKIYEHLLTEKLNSLSGKLGELAKKFEMTPVMFLGFLHGINEATDNGLDVEELDEESDVNFSFSWESLYKKMVEFKAKHLYTLPLWSNVANEEQQKEWYSQQKKSRTVVKGEKIGRNDPCICGSGKKYKKCCGALEE